MTMSIWTYGDVYQAFGPERLTGAPRQTYTGPCLRESAAQKYARSRLVLCAEETPHAGELSARKLRGILEPAWRESATWTFGRTAIAAAWPWRVRSSPCAASWSLWRLPLIEQLCST
jgi:hypothetical protein